VNIEFIPLAVAAYLLGSVPTAYLVARWRRGIDIRKYGSGNVGASNVLATVSKRWAIPVTIFDIGKGALTVWAARLVGLDAVGQITIGILTVIGHNWPVFLHFRGGRGVFTTLGVVTMISPKMGLIIFIMPYLLAPIRQVALGVTIALSSLPLFSWFLSQPLDIEEKLPITVGFIVLFLIGVSKRLLAPRTQLSQTVSTGRLVINRLLFDRDIRSRKAWLSQTERELGEVELPPERKEKKRGN
jgi:glycerol-3-phosphate acyltransferase PlsY